MSAETRKCKNCESEFLIEEEDFPAEGGSASGGDFYPPSYKTTEGRSKKIWK